MEKRCRYCKQKIEYVGRFENWYHVYHNGYGLYCDEFTEYKATPESDSKVVSRILALYGETM